MRSRPYKSVAPVLMALLWGCTMGCGGGSRRDTDPDPEQRESLDGVQDDRIRVRHSPSDNGRRR